MADLTNGEWVVRQVEMIASLSGRESAKVWRDLYDSFEHKVGIAFQRIAYVSDPPKKTLPVIREEGYLDQFAEFVGERLKALNDKPQGGA